MKKHHEYFSSRWGLLLAALGMCVGTGNIWRFPRMVAQNGGGAFIIAWLVFLFTWSIPLLICEFALGRKTRLGDWRVGKWFERIMLVFIPVEALAMIVWWLVSVGGEGDWWNPLGVYTFGTCLLQIGGAILVLIILNRWLTRRLHATLHHDPEDPD